MTLTGKVVVVTGAARGMGRAYVEGFLDTTHEDFLKMFDVSFFGTVKLTRAFMQPMLEKRSGSIIMVSSHGGAEKEVADGVLAMRSPRFEQPYQAAKSALTCFSGYLA